MTCDKIIFSSRNVMCVSFVCGYIIKNDVIGLEVWGVYGVGVESEWVWSNYWVEAFLDKNGVNWLNNLCHIFNIVIL